MRSMRSKSRARPFVTEKQRTTIPMSSAQPPTRPKPGTTSSASKALNMGSMHIRKRVTLIVSLWIVPHPISQTKRTRPQCEKKLHVLSWL